MKFVLVLCWLLASAPLICQRDTILSPKTKIKDSASLILDSRPKKALLIGLALPGGGQVFNQRWLKLPFVYGAYAGAGYYIQFTQKRFDEWDGYYQKAILENRQIEVRPGLSFSSKQIKVYRDKFRDDRDVAIFLTIGVHLLVALEAYVDAHLKYFNMDENIGFRAFPETRSVGLAFKLH